jgi:hypothetical protein
MAAVAWLIGEREGAIDEGLVGGFRSGANDARKLGCLPKRARNKGFLWIIISLDD